MVERAWYDLFSVESIDAHVLRGRKRLGASQGSVFVAGRRLLPWVVCGSLQFRLDEGSHGLQAAKTTTRQGAPNFLEGNAPSLVCVILPKT